MSSRDKEQTTPHHQPLLSSLVVRPSVSDGGGEGGGGRGAGSDYEPGEVRRDPPLYYRTDRYPDEPGSSLLLLIIFVFFFLFTVIFVFLILSSFCSPNTS